MSNWTSTLALALKMRKCALCGTRVQDAAVFVGPDDNVRVEYRCHGATERFYRSQMDMFRMDPGELLESLSPFRYAATCAGHRASVKKARFRSIVRSQIRRGVR